MKKKGFTLIELMVVILIVGILAAASIPLMRGRIDSAKWSEANAMAGTIRSAARVYFAEHGEDPDGVEWVDLGFNDGDLTGTYFDKNDFEITAVEEGTGNVQVTVTGDGEGKTPEGTYILQLNGDWDKQD